MAATLTHQTQKVLSMYTFIEADHPVFAAWLDYSYARATRDGVEAARRKLVRELALERQLMEVAA